MQTISKNISLTQASSSFLCTMVQSKTKSRRKIDDKSITTNRENLRKINEARTNGFLSRCSNTLKVRGHVLGGAGLWLNLKIRSNSNRSALTKHLKCLQDLSLESRQRIMVESTRLRLSYSIAGNQCHTIPRDRIKK
jgi:hypothetical protein